jgi:hypothetical protein
MKSANIRKLPRKHARVAGGAGFFDSHLCSRLLHDVTGNPEDFATRQRISDLASPQPPDSEQTMRAYFQGAIYVMHPARRRGARIIPAATNESYGQSDLHRSA